MARYPGSLGFVSLSRYVPFPVLRMPRYGPQFWDVMLRFRVQNLARYDGSNTFSASEARHGSDLLVNLGGHGSVFVIRSSFASSRKRCAHSRGLHAVQCPGGEAIRMISCARSKRGIEAQGPPRVLSKPFGVIPSIDKHTSRRFGILK